MCKSPCMVRAVLLGTSYAGAVVECGWRRMPSILTVVVCSKLLHVLLFMSCYVANHPDE